MAPLCEGGNRPCCRTARRLCGLLGAKPDNRMLRDELEALLSPLYSQETLGKDAIVHVHLLQSMWAR